jgi:hypothetical protein
MEWSMTGSHCYCCDGVRLCLCGTGTLTGLTWARTWASAVKSRRLTAWVTARPWPQIRTLRNKINEGHMLTSASYVQSFVPVFYSARNCQCWMIKIKLRNSVDWIHVAQDKVQRLTTGFSKRTCPRSSFNFCWWYYVDGNMKSLGWTLELLKERNICISAS